MMPLRRHITYANVCAIIAVVAALGTGGAWAAGHLITGKQILDHSITGRDIASNSVPDTVLRPGGIKRRDLAMDSVDGGAIDNGAVGIGDLSSSTVNTLELASIDGTSCHRSSKDGTLHLEYDDRGYASLFCEVPLTPDVLEPNDTLQTATALGTLNSVPSSFTKNANISPATDHDWYTFTVACPGGYYTGHSLEVQWVGGHPLYDVYRNGNLVASAQTTDYDSADPCSGGSTDVDFALDVAGSRMDSYQMIVGFT
jgi:hypothetical protein